MKISKELDNLAKSVSLSDYLLQNHPNEVHIHYGSVVLNKDPKVSVKFGYTGYTKWNNGETGGNVDYLIKYLGYDYVSAVMSLTKGISNLNTEYNTRNYESNPIIVERDINLPKQADHYKNLYAYLMSRSISADTIKDLIRKKLLYQSAEGNNVVFLSSNKDFAEIRGTNTFAERRCKHRDKCHSFQIDGRGWCKNSNKCEYYKKDGFHSIRKVRPDCFWEYSPYGSHEIIYVCEGSIDAISLYELHHIKGLDHKSSYVSLGGVSNKQTIERLKKMGKVILAVDNDDAGKKCRDDNSDLDYIIPKGKDWNDDLRGLF